VRPFRTRRRSGVLALGFVLLALAAPPLLGETPAGSQRDQNRIVSEIRQIQVQLATLVEAQTALSQAVEGLLADREEQVTADRQSRAETMNSLERMERSVATLSEAFRDTNERLSALMVEVESVREAQRRAALLDAGAGEDDGTAPLDGEEGEAPVIAAGEESPPEGSSGEGESRGEATVLDEPSVSEIYLQADADYLQGRYDLALTGFERVAESGGELADNARYFMGECHLAEDRLDPALEQFDILIRDFPDSSKIGEAWYKKGLIFGRMGHESDAREIFEDILDVFAGTTAARLAQRELDAMPPREPGV
jgi:TolA-binding protein